MKKVLTIAGSDCSGGAGIQADMKTIAAHGLYGMSAITALTAQNTTGVYGIMEVSPKFVAQQLDCIFQDIVPDAVKIGMVANSKIIKVISEKLQEYDAKNIVIDPVMVSTSESKLISDEAQETLEKYLLPLGIIITPNIPEAEVLSGISIKNENDMITAGAIISKKVKTSVLVKGGHLVNDAIDLLYKYSESEKTVAYEWFQAERINNSNTHGTGCTLSSAIACQLAMGKTLAQSIDGAKLYLTGALRDGMDLGLGSGPLNHVYEINQTSK